MAALKVHDSLTGTKVPFEPREKTVSWYACGPTVYDDAHLGHARNYVSTDIIRRILQDYFKYDVKFVMNITDVDDKIIIAAREQHVLEQWLFGRSTVDDEVRETTTMAFAQFLDKRLPNVSKADYTTYQELFQQQYGHVMQGKSLANDGTPPSDAEAKIKRYHKEALTAVKALSEGESDLHHFVEGASSVLKPYLDKLHGHRIDGSDHHIFTKLTKKYESRYFDDMASLNVRRPDKLTRVTEYGPQIVDFVKQIQANGFAYEHEGSVYFDTGKFESSGGEYAGLKPGSKADKELQADGEGALATKETGFKRSSADFALWKASKPGEPSWPSPWGPGRPGWHIECSAMAVDVLGDHIDIHSGGSDLAFPHHTNEKAQSEAYMCEQGHIHLKIQWVDIWMHMGHLSIEGQKMSKSLKNFTTIREALSTGEYTARSLRIIFLQGAWRGPLEISKTVKETAEKWEERVDNFFLKVNDLPKESGVPDVKDLSLATNGTEKSVSALLNYLAKAQKEFDDALRDSFDTPTAMRVIGELIGAYNKDPNVPNGEALQVARWITEMVHMFGLDAEPLEPGQIGWSGAGIPAAASPYVGTLASWRDTVRSQAKTDATTLPPLHELDASTATDNQFAAAYNDFRKYISGLPAGDISVRQRMEASDYLRDTVLWNVSIGLEDRDGRPSLVRPLSEKARQERAAAEDAAAKKSAAKAAREKEEQEKLEKGQLDPLEMFKTDEYSAWDDEGMPTKDKEGKEIAKNASKKLRKRWEVQKKAHEAWLKSRSGT